MNSLHGYCPYMNIKQNTQKRIYQNVQNASENATILIKKKR